METDVKKPWLALRECWTELECSKEHSLGNQPLPMDLEQRHKRALEALVAGGELSADVAERVKVAFSKTFSHIQGSMSMCYMVMMPAEPPRLDFVKQVAALEEMAGSNDLDPGAVGRVREALERDITWLAQPPDKGYPQDIAWLVQPPLDGGNPGDVSDIAVDAIKVDASSAEAARVLIELLLQGG
jgi:hypothetical protein